MTRVDTVPRHWSLNDPWVDDATYIDTFYEALRDTGRNVLAKAAAAAKAAKVESKLVLVEARAATVAHVIVQQARKLKADVISLSRDAFGRAPLRLPSYFAGIGSTPATLAI